MKLNGETNKIMADRFSKDTIIALATTVNNIPYVRNVNAYYDNSAFYIITYARSNKIKHLSQNPAVSIAGDWFTAHGQGVNLGFFGKSENQEIANKLKAAFKEWIDNGHTNLNDENTVILCIKLTHGLLFSHGTKYDIEF